MICSLDHITATHKRRARLVVLASGSGTNFENIVTACQSDLVKADVVALIVNRKNAGAIERAKRLDVEHHVVSHKAFETREAFDAVVVETITPFDPDLVILAGWMRLASKPLLDAFSHRMLNIHPSLLPSFRGLRAIEQAFEAGVGVTGCSVHIVTEELDGGPIIGQTAVVVAETLHETEERIHDAEYVLYPRAIQTTLNRIVT